MKQSCLSCPDGSVIIALVSCQGIHGSVPYNTSKSFAVLPSQTSEFSWGTLIYLHFKNIEISLEYFQVDKLLKHTNVIRNSCQA